MIFKILCRSFEAPTKPYQIKQQNKKSAKKWQRRSGDNYNCIVIALLLCFERSFGQVYMFGHVLPLPSTFFLEGGELFRLKVTHIIWNIHPIFFFLVKISMEWKLWKNWVMYLHVIHDGVRGVGAIWHCFIACLTLLYKWTENYRSLQRNARWEKSIIYFDIFIESRLLYNF